MGVRYEAAAVCKEVGTTAGFAPLSIRQLSKRDSSSDYKVKGTRLLHSKKPWGVNSKEIE